MRKEDILASPDTFFTALMKISVHHIAAPRGVLEALNYPLAFSRGAHGVIGQHSKMGCLRAKNGLRGRPQAAATLNSHGSTDRRGLWISPATRSTRVLLRLFLELQM